jgi:hypothetical protein
VGTKSERNFCLKQRKPAHNSGLAKVAVQCSADTFVVNQSLVLLINISSENRHLRQAANRYGQVLKKKQKQIRSAKAKGMTTQSRTKLKTDFK